MKTSSSGVAAIRMREGCVLHWYKDSVGVWTCCVGHTGRASPPVYEGPRNFTQDEADEILADDLEPFEGVVNRTIVNPPTQHQFDAMVSLAFNIGTSTFGRSTVARELNAGDIQGAADAFLLFNKAGGKVLPGLVNRRESERAQFLGDVRVIIAAAHAVPTPGPIVSTHVGVPAPAAPQTWADRLKSMFFRRTV